MQEKVFVNCFIPERPAGIEAPAPNKKITLVGFSTMN